MTYLPIVVRAEYLGDFRLLVAFSDGSVNTIDFAGWLRGPVFEPLRDPQYFQKFFIDGGTVMWPNGADIAPETLYEVPGRKKRSIGRSKSRKSRSTPAVKARRRIRARG